MHAISAAVKGAGLVNSPLTRSKSLVASLTCALLVAAGAARAGDAPAASQPSKPSSHTTRAIEGWKVLIDDRLLASPNEALGARALRFLEYKLSDINAVVAPEPLAKLHAVTIVLDLVHGTLGVMQYHPDAGWLKEHGYSTDLAKCVHIPEAADLVTPRNITEQPWVVLHELAHAYHDQVLGFEEPRIMKAYEDFKKSGHGDHALLYDGTRVRHYGLTDQKEFFAEMTESYFGLDDFFPFNRAELMTAEPAIFELMQAIWGPVAGGALKAVKTAGRSKVKPVSPKEAATVLWYDAPAAKWAEALPVGNGRLGAMVLGGTETERIPLNEHSDTGTGFGMAWKAACWARLLDGEHANVCLANLVAHQTCPNLFSICFSAPQLEGACGATAAIAEMLLQSHAGELHILPALPAAWSRGSVKGLRGRGGFEVDVTWNEGKLTAAAVRSTLGGPCRLRYGEKTAEVAIDKGAAYVWEGE